MTIRPTPVMRWGASLVAIATGGAVLLGPIQDMVARHEALRPIDVLFASVFIAVGAVFIVLGVIDWSSYIRVDGTSIVLGSVLTRRQYDRNDIARITVNADWAYRPTRFIRSDGSVALTTSGFLWGRARLKLLADYLGVPLAW